MPSLQVFILSTDFPPLPSTMKFSTEAYFRNYLIQFPQGVWLLLLSSAQTLQQAQYAV